VNLANNHIETFVLVPPVSVPEVTSAASPIEIAIASPIEIAIEGNPLLCDCSAMELKQELTSCRFFRVRNPEGVTCGIASPPELVNRSLLHVGFEVS